MPEQPTNEQLEQKLDEIKTALNIETVTTSVIDEIKSKLVNLEKENKRSTLISIAAFSGSYVLTGLVLTLTAADIPKAFGFGWGLVGIGIAGALVCWYKSSKIK
ncbi:MAG: hypothetical protein PHG35_03560 [Dehalococcoidales bacterium]|nr:hypothetical protein [Dehalococcoidales bacterium]